MNEETNFKAICSLTTSVMDLPDGSLSFKDRKRKLQTARSVAGYIGLTEENINRNVIAKVLNRDRTATYHYERSHDKNFQHCNVYRKTFEKVYKKYKDVDGEKDMFITGKYMKKYLLQNRVYESRNSDVKLLITSGQAKCTIYTTYFDYTNQLEFINIALKDYHFTIKII